MSPVQSWCRICRSSLLVPLFAVTLAGCALPSGQKGLQKVYDFGPPQNGLSAPKGASTLVVPLVEPSSGLDSTAITYRLGYAAANQPMPYANSHWAMAPAELVTQLVRDQLAPRMNVMATSDNSRALVLRVALEEFSQVFDSPETSRGLIVFRATLVRDGGILGQRNFIAEESAPSADAAGGVAAITKATRTAVASLATWVGEMVP